MDVIVAADVVWTDELLAPLVETMACLSDPATTTYLAYQSRSTRTDGDHPPHTHPLLRRRRTLALTTANHHRPTVGGLGSELVAVRLLFLAVSP